jgi:predicted ATPase
MATRLDVRRVQLRHYRSIVTCDVRLGPLTMLVGPNGSGKSNFLDALRLTAQALDENLDNALRERGGVGEVRRRSRRSTSLGIRIDFVIDNDALVGHYAFQIAATGDGGYRVLREQCRAGAVDDEFDFFDVRNGELVGSTQRVMPPAVSDRLFLASAAGIDVFRPVFDGLSAITVYNISPDAMRRPQKPETGDSLRRDGSNVASVFGRLRRERPAAKERIVQYLSRIVSGIIDVDRKTLPGWEAIEFRQEIDNDSHPWRFPGSSMSDGTLRALGVLVALFGGTTALASPVGIEEPESALHPAAAGLLLDALRDASEARQVLVTTHSPDLLDSPMIRPEELLAVRAVDGVTTIGKVDDAGHKAIKEALFTPGELLRVDQLTPSRESSQHSELFS